MYANGVETNIYNFMFAMLLFPYFCLSQVCFSKAVAVLLKLSWAISTLSKSHFYLISLTTTLVPLRLTHPREDIHPWKETHPPINTLSTFVRKQETTVDGSPSVKSYLHTIS